MRIIQSRAVSKSWFFQQDIMRQNLGLTRSFSNHKQMINRMDDLNRRNIISEVKLERLLQRFCKVNNIELRLRKNWPVLNKYFGDFVSVKEKIVIEADGSFHDRLDSKEADKIRDKNLKDAGWIILRVRVPSMEGIDAVYSIFRQMRDLRKSKGSNFKKERTENYKNRGLSEMRIKANEMLIGCRNDSTTLSLINKKNKKMNKLRQHYIKAGINPNKFLK